MFKRKILSSLSALGGILSAGTARAQGLTEAGKNLGKAGEKAGLNVDAGLSDVLAAFISAALTLVGLIFLILMIYGGYLWMTAQGEEEKVGKAHKIITAAVIGLVVVLSAYAITYFILW